MLWNPNVSGTELRYTSWPHTLRSWLSFPLLILLLICFTWFYKVFTQKNVSTHSAHRIIRTYQTACVPWLCYCSCEGREWIGLSAFQQQQTVNGKVSTAQTWLARWLDDRLYGSVNQVRFRTAHLRLSVRNDFFSYPHRIAQIQQEISCFYLFLELFVTPRWDQGISSYLSNLAEDNNHIHMFI